jgi:hypothetical protein
MQPQISGRAAGAHSRRYRPCPIFYFLDSSHQKVISLGCWQSCESKLSVGFEKNAASAAPKTRS